jgi:hypothetical protein
VDLATILAAIVAVLILLSGYLLFNEMPSFGKGSSERRPGRRP